MAPQSKPKTRNGAGHYLPGVSGNPGGRPKGVERQVKDLVGEQGEKVLLLLWQIAQSSDQTTRDRISACEILLERGFGRPSQAVELSGGLLDGSEAVFSVQVVSPGSSQ
jgi:hypothetical protein